MKKPNQMNNQQILVYLKALLKEKKLESKTLVSEIDELKSMYKNKIKCLE